MAERAGTVHPVPGHPREIRTVIYTTDAIESLNYQRRKVPRTAGTSTRTRYSSLLYLAVPNLGGADRFGDTSSATRYWRAARSQFEIFFPGSLHLP